MTVIDSVDVSAYTIPTERPESDGTLEWDATTMVLVEARGGGEIGVGYTYCHEAAAKVVRGTLAGIVEGLDVMAVGAAWASMWHAVRNFGQTGLVSMAVSAVDIALWDLKARVLGQSLAAVLDAVHDSVPIYGSGGFCSYTDAELTDQLSAWAEAGIPRVKIKVGRDPRRDHERLAVARKAIGEGVELFVDANGAFTRSAAVRWSGVYAAHDVRWYEEPVSSDDLAGLRSVRQRAPAGVEVAAGEYGWNLPYFQRMLDAGAVDCLQVDVTRCGGISALKRVGALCDARSIDVSAHCAPQASAHACTALWRLRHLEYFHTHNRIENVAFDGCLVPQPGGVLRPDRSRPGTGLTVKREDIEKWRVC